ncbi:hypothetical protein H7J06_24575 [Mycobacterium hodleri]|uniref:hypothetical protein n=1 Tax=Mycolicibacterium hodleri TaxID=49897 RepID=UPI0021F31B03|nr:hypothetical protein [Mycolicibacterium hodleri]MCV7136152.1 hypothetical protein [Mycolicibacterium hodleri]
MTEPTDHALATTLTAGIVDVMTQLGPNLACLSSLTRAVALLDDGNPVLMSCATELDKVRLLLGPALFDACTRVGYPKS